MSLSYSPPFPRCLPLDALASSRGTVFTHIAGAPLKAERLTREFASRALARRPEVLLLARADAIELVSRASEEGVPVLAVDAVPAGTTSSSARPERIADFSSGVAQGHGCWQAAESCIRDHPDAHTLFSLTLGNDPVEVI